MNEAASSPKYDVSAGKIDQTVCPRRFPSLPLRQANRATIPSIAMPRCSRYHRARASGSLALKKMPPIPVTRARRVRAAMPRSGPRGLKRFPISPVRAGHPGGSAGGLEIGEDSQVFAQVPRNEEVLADPFPSRLSHRLPFRRIAEELDRTVGTFPHAGHEVTVTTVLDLDADAGDIAPDNGDALPEGLAHDETESFAERLCDRHVGLSLEDVHFERTDSAEIGQEVNVRIIARVPGRALEPQPAFRIVAGHRGEQQELHLRNLLLHEPIRIDDAERIFPWIEAADLTDYGPVEIDVEPRQDCLELLSVHVAVLRA